MTRRLYGRGWRSLPDALGARSLRALARAVTAARTKKRAVIFGLGGTRRQGRRRPPPPAAFCARASSPTSRSTAAFLIHDYELGRFGATSEDVRGRPPDGRFGLARETGEELNALVSQAAAERKPVGTLAGAAAAARGSHAEWSVLAAAAAAGIRSPCTWRWAATSSTSTRRPTAGRGAGGARGLPAAGGGRGGPERRRRLRQRRFGGDTARVFLKR